MTGEIFLDEYERQTIDELLALEHSHRIDSLVGAIETAIESRREAGGKLSDVETVVLAVEAMEREVNNGGFSQFFYNSSVEYAPVIVSSLNAIDCPEIGKLAGKALACLGLDSLDPESIERRMDPDDDVLEEKLDEIDDKYYKNDEIVCQKLFEYIKENKALINIP